MRARAADEPHRVATPLELFFDLCFVVAVAQAALPLHHDIAEDHIRHGVSSYLMVFFAIWWAWMNFTWFASAYDCDDDVYRITTLVQIAGALVLAAGVGSAFLPAGGLDTGLNATTSPNGRAFSFARVMGGFSSIDGIRLGWAYQTLVLSSGNLGIQAVFMNNAATAAAATSFNPVAMLGYV